MGSEDDEGGRRGENQPRDSRKDRKIAKKRHRSDSLPSSVTSGSSCDDGKIERRSGRSEVRESKDSKKRKKRKKRRASSEGTRKDKRRREDELQQEGEKIRKRERKKSKKKKEKNPKREKCEKVSKVEGDSDSDSSDDPDVRRSVITGKRIMMNLDRTSEDHARERGRKQLLQFMNSQF